MKNNWRFLFFSVLLIVYCLLGQSRVYAAYVLPYPSVMPGNKIYRLSRMVDTFKRYWHWGNLSSYRYFLGQSDKALVEAKTLFEYNQYLLAVGALDRSNTSLKDVPEMLRRAKDEGKNIEKYRQELMEAMDAHRRVLAKIKSDTPEEFTWTPEKSTPQLLYIHKLLGESERLRREIIPTLP